MPDELCEVAEICTGMSLISSTIISCGVHHLRELRRKIVVFHLAYILSMSLSQLESCQVFQEEGEKKKRGALRCVLGSAREA